MDELTILRIVLAIIIGTLVAIAYSVRYLILLERRVAKIEMHTDRLVTKILEERKAHKRIRKPAKKKKSKKRKR